MGSRIRPAERCQLSNSASRDLSPKQPPAVAFAACAEAVNTFLGAECGSPRVIADQTKFAAAHGTAIGRRARSGLRLANLRKYGCITHCCLPLLLAVASAASGWSTLPIGRERNPTGTKRSIVRR